MYENSFLDKCILSAYLLIRREFRNSMIDYIILPSTFKCDKNMGDLIIWLCLAKLPANSEGLSEKDFEFLDRLFTHFNQVRCHRVLRSRYLKQYDKI